jgi:hypothetical protein
VRIVAGEDGAARRLTAVAAEGPETGDQIVQSGAALVFVDSAAISFLSDKVLSVERNRSGAAAFVVHEQA